MKLIALMIIASFSLSTTSWAEHLPNRTKALKADMKKCEASVKKYVDLGYPEKADQQILKCKKIQDKMAKIKTGQAKVERKLASLGEKKKGEKKKSLKHAKKTKKKHQ